MLNYTDTIAALAQTTKAREDALPLLNEACRSQFFFHPQPTDRVCVFFHGFTAGPYQFVPIAQAFYQAGYNVLVPLMPGHGQAGNWSKQNPPPLPTDPTVYQQFALDWLAQAQALGEQVIVGGLSGGGTVAAWLALEQPQALYRTLLFAPYLSSSSRILDLFIQVVNGYSEWKQDPKAAQFPGGYTGFAVPALRTLLDLGQAVLNRSRQARSASPTFIISSGDDTAVSNSDHQTLFEDLCTYQPITWHYCFDRVLDIPHTMMTPQEGNAWSSLLPVMSKAFVESYLTWAEVEEIAYGMTEGKTFNAVVQELGLAQKASPDMPAMVTMVDKRDIVLARSSSGWDED